MYDNNNQSFYKPMITYGLIRLLARQELMMMMNDNLQCKVLGSVGIGGGFEGVPDPGVVGLPGFVGVTGLVDGAGALIIKKSYLVLTLEF